MKNIETLKSTVQKQVQHLASFYKDIHDIDDATFFVMGYFNEMLLTYKPHKNTSLKSYLLGQAVEIIEKTYLPIYQPLLEIFGINPTSHPNQHYKKQFKPLLKFELDGLVKLAQDGDAQSYETLSIYINELAKLITELHKARNKEHAAKYIASWLDTVLESYEYNPNFRFDLYFAAFVSYKLENNYLDSKTSK